ncbi:hypothetical protein ACJX0J_020319, partial [Zea mays]
QASKGATITGTERWSGPRTRDIYVLLCVELRSLCMYVFIICLNLLILLWQGHALCFRNYTQLLIFNTIIYEHIFLTVYTEVIILDTIYNFIRENVY